MRKILLITGSRGEYGYIRPILQLIDKSKKLDYEIVATNMHLLPEFGNSIDAFIQDGFKVKYSPLMTYAGYTPESMVKSLSSFGSSMADILTIEKPDIILLAGDRGEQFMAALAGAHMNIPVAHIQAGELSGNIDGLTRHAIARYTHIHFSANKDASQRLLKTGEQKERIFEVGAPQLDEFVSQKISSLESLKKQYNFDFELEYILFVQHSVTEEVEDAGYQMKITLDALNSFDKKVVLIMPNSDAGSSVIRNAIDENHNVNTMVLKNVPREDYAAFMKNASCIIGNSSSGLLEAPNFELPAVNIGNRQIGRYRGKNVIDCDYDHDDILRALRKATSKNFKKSLHGMKNPYGDGRSSHRIIKILEDIEINDFLLKKKLTY